MQVGIRACRPCMGSGRGFLHASRSLCAPVAQSQRPYRSLHRYYERWTHRQYSNISPETGRPAEDQSTDGHSDVVNQHSSLSIEANARQARLRYGSVLPEGLLSAEEYHVYQRLYGPPVSTLSAEEAARVENGEEPGDAVPASEEASSQELINSATESLEEEEVWEEEEEWDEDEDTDRMLDRQRAEEAYHLMNVAQEGSHPRAHPLTVAGRFSDTKETLVLPEESMVLPTSRILNELSNKHLTEAAQKAFGPWLQDSTATPPTSRGAHMQQRPVALSASSSSMTATEAGAFIACNMPGMYASITAALVESRKRLGTAWLERLLRRQGGPRVLDVGSAGAGVLSWREVLRAEWEQLNPDAEYAAEKVPAGKSTVVIGARELRERITNLLSDTTFLPRLPDFDRARDLPGLDAAFDPGARKHYDVIIASHSLWPLGEDFQRKDLVQNLWSLLDPHGGVLILVEKGVPRGFEMIGGARSLLLDQHVSSSPSAHESTSASEPGSLGTKEKGMIIAPCTNHGRCPMYTIPGQMQGRKDFCRFATRFHRPAYLTRILGPRARHHERIRFSFLAVQRGRDLRETSEIPIRQDEAATLAAVEGYERVNGAAEPSAVHPLSLPRIIAPPLKRTAHVIFDVCTPNATIERWILPRSKSKWGYRDARKSRWGDLWALGAKTRILREVRTGLPADKANKKKGSGRKGRKERGRRRREDEDENEDENEAWLE